MTKPGGLERPAAGEATTQPPPSRAPWRRWLPLVILALAMAGAYAAGLHRHLSLDAVLAQRDWLKQAVEANRPLALAAFAGAYAGAIALCFPGAALLTLLSGFLFGGIGGALVAILGATVGALAFFTAARSSLGEVLQQRAGAGLQRLLAGFRDDAVSYLLFLRLVPAFPFWLVNLAAALGGVSLPVFAWTTLVGILPGSFAFAFAGAGLDSVIAAQSAAKAACLAAGGADCAIRLDWKALVTRELLVAFALLGCVALIPAIWRRISKAERSQAERPE